MRDTHTSTRRTLQPGRRPTAAAVVIALAVCIAGSVSRLRAEEADGGGDTQPKTLEDVDQRLRILERKQELDKEKEAEKAKDTALVGAGKDGFFLRSASGDFLLKIRGYIQLDGRFFQEDQERPGIDTFLIRRGRPILEGTIYKIFDFRIMPDFGEGKTVLQDAYMDARFSPLLSLRAGKFKAPVGLERLQSATDILFVERALPTNLVPNRDLGVELYGAWRDGVLGWAGGVFNGVPDGGSADADTNNSKEVAARLFALPFKKTSVRALQQFGIGVAGTLGDNNGTPAATGLAAYKAASQATFFSFRSDGTVAGTVVADGRHARISPQAYYYAGRFGSLAEYVRSTQEVERATAELTFRSRAWQVSASFLLTDDEASYKSVSPRKPFDRDAHGWGAFEVVGRLGRLSVDKDAFPVFANPATSSRTAREWAGGVNWYLNRNFKIMLDYAQTRFDGGAAIGDRVDERVILTRFQTAF